MGGHSESLSLREEVGDSSGEASTALGRGSKSNDSEEPPPISSTATDHLLTPTQESKPTFS